MAEESRTSVLTGGCQCGAVRYALSATPRSTICHCRMCQKATGGPFAALGMVARGDLAWTRGSPAYFESSSVATRGFCEACGTPLTYDAHALDEGQIEVTIGSLDQPGLAPPQEQFGVESRLPWFDGMSALPASATCTKFDGVVSHQHPDHDTP